MRKAGVGGVLAAACVAVTWSALSAQTPAQQPAAEYWAYACAESDDTIALVRFRPSGPGQGSMDVVKTITVVIWPT
jgi:hypothetical protein